MANLDWRQVQIRLQKFGFNPGPIDGIRGRMTISAVKRFQASKGLLVDGIVGPKTYGALFGEAAPGDAVKLDTMPWYQEAVRLTGTNEASGSANNPVIIDWAEQLDIDYAGDDIPWCGLFIAHCVGSTLTDESLPNGPLGARNWLQFGVECEAQLGAVMVFWRHRRSGWQGHVGFYAGEDSGAYHILGGNQSDSVNVARIARNRFLGARWPVTALSPSGEIVVNEADGALSQNEQ